MSDEISSKSVQKVKDVLKHYGIDTKVVDFSQSTRTAQEAADAIRCNVAQIVKSLIFCTEKAHEPILVLTSGSNRVNEKNIEILVNDKIKKADAQLVREATGFAIGGVAPFGHVKKMMTFIDEDLLQYKIVWAAAGTPHTVFSLIPSDLVRMTHGIVAKINN